MRNRKKGVGMCPPQKRDFDKLYIIYVYLIKPTSGGSETQIEPIF